MFRLYATSIVQYNAYLQNVMNLYGNTIARGVLVARMPSPEHRSRGVMVSTLDFESSDPSSSLGGT